MTETLKIMEHAEANGHNFSLEGEKLRVTMGKHLPRHLKEQITQYKQHILDVLERDRQARQAGFIIGIPGTLYTRSVSKHSAAYLECIDGQWVAWRETYQNGKQQAVSTKTIVQAATFDYALDKTASYFMHLERHNR